MHMTMKQTTHSTSKRKQVNTLTSHKRYTGGPAQKWEQAVKLRELAWDLKWAFVKQKHPDWDDVQIKNAVREIFLHAST